jgi:hypothetical protein
MSALFFAEAQRQAVTPVDAPQQVGSSDIGLPVSAPFITDAQREAAIRRGLALANFHEVKARHARALVAQLKEKA